MTTGAWRNGALLAVVSVSIALLPAVDTPQAQAAVALVMGGTDQPNPAELGDYLPRVGQEFLDPTTSCTIAVCRVEPVNYPAEFWPFPQWGGLEALTYDRSVAEGVVSLNAGLQRELTSGPDEPIAMFGASQSATAVTILKRNLAGAAPQVKSDLEMVVIANPNRPNGGLLSRFYPLSIPIFEFSANGATPTDTGIKTTDITFQYDAAADFPRYPLNLLALLNIVIGMDIHGSYTTTRNGYTELELRQAIDDPANRQTFGDTTYITIPTKDLPLVQPIRQFGAARGISAITEPLVALIEPTLRVLVELGYDRSVEYGRPTPAGLFPRVNPGKLMSDLATAVRTGITDARAEIAAQQQHSPIPAATPPATPTITAGNSPTRRAASTSHRDDDALSSKRGSTHRYGSSTQSNRHADEPAPDSTPAPKSNAADRTDTADSGSSEGRKSPHAGRTSDRKGSHRESVRAS
jgi:hypothetical protein